MNSSVKLLIRSAKKEYSSIYIQVIVKRKSFLLVSPYKILSERWDSKKQESKNIEDREFNEVLLLMKKYISDEIKAYDENNFEPTQFKNWLIRKIKQSSNKSEHSSNSSNLLIDWYDYYIEQAKSRVADPITKGTLKTIQTSKKRMEAFIEYRFEVPNVNSVDRDFYRSFVTYLRFKKYNENTIGTDIKKLKTVLKFAKANNMQIDEFIYSDEFKTISKTKQQRIEDTITLSLDELKLIDELELEGTKAHARDWLVISCFTACRGEDLLSLNDSNISYDDDGDKVISYHQDKVKIIVDVPVFQEIENKLFPPTMELATYNRLIKEICKEAGINKLTKGSKTITFGPNKSDKRKVHGIYEKWELVTSHIGRRSYITNFYHDFELSEIRMVTGHSSEASLLTYIGKDNNKAHIKSMKKKRTI